MTPEEIAYQARTYPHRDIEKMIRHYAHIMVKDAIQKKQKQATFPIEYYCQMDIEDKGICTEQCIHCKEYYKMVEDGER